MIVFCSSMGSKGAGDVDVKPGRAVGCPRLGNEAAAPVMLLDNATGAKPSQPEAWCGGHVAAPRSDLGSTGAAEARLAPKGDRQGDMEGLEHQKRGLQLSIRTLLEATLILGQS